MLGMPSLIPLGTLKWPLPLEAPGYTLSKALLRLKANLMGESNRRPGVRAKRGHHLIHGLPRSIILAACARYRLCSTERATSHR